MIEIIVNIFNWIVNAVTNILTLIVSIPKYTAAMITWITTLIPAEILVFFMVMFTAYVIIHIKRLVL